MKTLILAFALSVGAFAHAGTIKIYDTKLQKELDLPTPNYSVVGLFDQKVHFYYDKPMVHVGVSIQSLKANGIDAIQFLKTIKTDPSAVLECYASLQDPSVNDYTCEGHSAVQYF